MVGAVGRISTIACCRCSRAQGVHGSPSSPCLCDHGEVAGLVSHIGNGSGRVGAQPPGGKESLRHLAALLEPLHSNPEELADRLLCHFGSIGGIAVAPDSDIRSCATYGERWVDAYLMVRRLLNDGLREKVTRSRLGENPRTLSRYLLNTMRGFREERMLAIFADAAGFVISEEFIAEGSQGNLLLSPRRIFGRALTLDARRILLAHNHPSGVADPSKIDIEQTKALVAQARALGVFIEDHFIVGRSQVVSMRARGLI